MVMDANRMPSSDFTPRPGGEITFRNSGAHHALPLHERHRQGRRAEIWARLTFFGTVDPVGLWGGADWSLYYDLVERHLAKIEERTGHLRKHGWIVLDQDVDSLPVSF